MCKNNYGGVWGVRNCPKGDYVRVICERPHKRTSSDGLNNEFVM